ncbi:MAG TPA: MlaE family lipid ABC transporter permease subunit [Casimicrobiaceae bacterium]
MARAPSASSSPAIAIDDRGAHVALRGALGIHTLPALDASLRARPPQGRSRSLDLSGLTALDTPGALFLCGLRNEGAALTGVRPEHQALLDLVGGLELKPLPKQPSVRRWREFVIELGKGVDDAWCDAYDILVFVGRAVNAIATALLRWRTLRLPSIARQIEQTGIRALPIIGLLAIMIAVVIGYQSVAQLRPYGGEDFTINLVAVSVLREMGVLITAIMVAGRSGSAFTAEIGVMKAREEIDALQVMGIDPMEVLVVPRLIGLIITLPLLTFFADVMGLLGGAMISKALLDVSLLQYLDRVRQAADVHDLFIGLVKAPVFAFFVGIIGCMHGLRVRGSAQSVGEETTRAVVKGIFLVIVLDALFSVLFEKLGL